jgi:hypothetical protein
MPRIYKAASAWTGTIGSGGVADGSVTTIPLSSATGLTNGEWYVFSIDRVDANGNKTPSKWEVATGQLSGTNFINCTRGVEGTAQAHAAGATVEILFTATHWDELRSFLEVEHNQDGTHKNITATSLTTTGDVEVGGVTVLTQQSSTPSNPASGKNVVYVKSDGYLYYLNSSGVERRWYPPIVDNNVAYQGKDSGGTARSIAKVNSSNVLEIADANLSNVKIISPTGTGYSGVDVYPTYVDLSNAGSDYDLQIGQRAVISFSSVTSKPLRIATASGRVYRMILAPSNNYANFGGGNNPVLINPNNTTYTNAFHYTEIYINDASVGSGYQIIMNAFRVGYNFSFCDIVIKNDTTSKMVLSTNIMYGAHYAFPILDIATSVWNDTSTAWTSLGTVVFPQSSSGKIIVERIA